MWTKAMWESPKYISLYDYKQRHESDVKNHVYAGWISWSDVMNLCYL